jgi:hypothetical protein
MKTFLGISTAAVVAFALIVAWLGFSSAQKARTALADLSARRAKLDSELGSAQARFAGASHDEMQLQAALQEAQSRAEKQAAAAKKTAAPSAPQGRPDLAALLEARPELRALFKRSFQANLGLRYSLLYHTAGFSPTQIQKFEELMTDAEQDRMDLQATAKAQGLAATDPAIANMRQQMDAKLQTAQKEILGDAGYEDLQQYKRKEPLVSFLNRAADLVAHTSTPLTVAQGEQVLNVLAGASSSYRDGGTASPASVDWPRALQQIQPLLPPAQFDSVKANSRGLEIMALVKQYYQQRAAAGK